MIGFILFILISLGVINSLFMSIYERIYEFGVLSAIGTSRWEIISLVLLEALFLGVISSLIGLVVGSVANYYFSLERSPAWRNRILWGYVWKRQFIYRTSN